MRKQPNQSYSFPAASTQWTAPDKRRWKYRLYDKLIYLFNLSVEPFFPASLVPHLSSDVYSFLTHETLNVCHESSPSQDYSCMGVLVFPRLHHLNLHGFEKELEDELHALDITKTTSKEQVMRVRVLLRDYGSLTSFLSPNPTH
jgi:hypothetical protein